MQRLRGDTRIKYGRAAQGSLRIFRSAEAFARAIVAAGRLSSEGLTFRSLSNLEAVQLEPALEPIANRLAGAIHYHADEVGDAYQFCVELTNLAQQRGVDFRFRTEVCSLEGHPTGVTAAITNHERFVADCYLVAAGSYSPLLLHRFGIRLPVEPAKGYSITVNSHQDHKPLRIPIIDDQLHAAVVPLTRKLRVAGTAEFAGYDLTLRLERTHSLMALLKAMLPEIRFEPRTIQPWCGLRSMSPDGIPIIGRTCIPNLWVNTGHGHLGWTMAAGSAQFLVDLMFGDSPRIDPLQYDPQRFLSARTIRRTQ